MIMYGVDREENVRTEQRLMFTISGGPHRHRGQWQHQIGMSSDRGRDGAIHCLPGDAIFDGRREDQIWPTFLIDHRLLVLVIDGRSSHIRGDSVVQRESERKCLN